MYCSRCGTQMNDAALCATCGQPAMTPATTAPLPHAPQLTSYATPGSQKMTFDTQLQVPLAGWWRRAGASAIDTVALFIVGLIVRAMVKGTAGIVIAAAVSLVYAAALISSKSGQTLGNRALGTRVRDQRGADGVSLARSVIRWMVQHLPATIATLASSARLSDYTNWVRLHPNHFNIQSIPPHIVSDIRFAMLCWLPVFIFLLVNYLSPLWDQRNRTVHDIVAGTVVTYSR